MNKERTFLGDGLNSLVHVGLGMASVLLPQYSYYIWAGFVMYQVSTYIEKQDHVFIDMSEFILGVLAIKLY